MITYNGNVLTVNNKWLYKPNMLDIFDFIYLANNFNGDYIPNSADSSFGNYLEHGTLTKNGSGANCYLSNGYSDNNYLYKTLRETELNKFKAVDSTYTFFFRVYNSTNGTGGIVSTRTEVNTTYNYMIRSYGNSLEIHTRAPHYNNNFKLYNPDIVYKVQISGNTFTTKNLIHGTEWVYNDNSDRSMGRTMYSFFAGYNDENHLERFYGLAGIAKETSVYEDEYIKDILLNQNLGYYV